MSRESGAKQIDTPSPECGGEITFAWSYGPLQWAERYDCYECGLESVFGGWQ